MTWSISWILSGVGLAVTSLFFLDRYAPKLGTFWNIMHGDVAGFPYRYILLAAACLVFYGCSRLMKEYDKRNPI